MEVVKVWGHAGAGSDEKADALAVVGAEDVTAHAGIGARPPLTTGTTEAGPHRGIRNQSKPQRLAPWTLQWAHALFGPWLRRRRQEGVGRSVRDVVAELFL